MHLSKVKKLLVIRLSSLGDILLTTPLLRAVKRNYPHIEIDFILKEEFYDLIKLNPYVKNILSYNVNEKEIVKLSSVIADNRYDLILDLQNNFRSRRLLKYSGKELITKTPEEISAEVQPDGRTNK